MDIRTCRNCGKTFDRDKKKKLRSGGAGIKYCSPRCAVEFNSKATLARYYKKKAQGESNGL